MFDKVFVSYHNDFESALYKHLLNAWSKNRHDDVKFSDYSIGTSINSNQQKYLKHVITQQIKQCNKFLCLIDQDTYESHWVKWEIDTAEDLGRRIIGVKIHEKYIFPTELKYIGATLINSFKYDAIEDALDR